MSVRILVFLTFLEGVSVLFVELMGGKLLTPFYGNSLVVWTSTLGVTMSSLMIGYFLGGKLCTKNRAKEYMIWLLLLISLWIISMPRLAEVLISIKSDSSIYWSSISSCLKLLSVPLVALGCLPPMLVQVASTDVKLSGKVTGYIFAVSTIGGAMSAFIIGLIIFEKYGVTMPSIFYGVVLGLITLVIGWKNSSKKALLIIISLSLFANAAYMFSLSSESTSIYRSDGLLGQIKVEDERTSEGAEIRTLTINGIAQTKENISLKISGKGVNYSDWLYPHVISAIASTNENRTQALLLGFGGGSVGHELSMLGYRIDAVEIDRRFEKIALDYYFYDFSNTNFIVEDARYFLNANHKKYDLIVIDLLSGEVQPDYVFTVECFEKMKSSLTEKGMIIINYQSNKSEPKKPYLTIFKTLIFSGYDVKVSESENSLADYIFVASLTKLDFDQILKYQKINPCCRFMKSYSSKLFIDFKSKENLNREDYKNALILTDDRPRLDLLNKETIKFWRTHANK